MLVREDQPVNLVGAFEEAVVGTAGYVAESADKLATHFKSVGSMAQAPRQVLVIRANDAATAVDSLGDATSLDEAVTRLGAVADSVPAPSAV